MATRPQSILLTYDDYVRLPDDGKRYEILEGDLAVTPAPTVGHQFSSIGLATVIYQHVEGHDLGILLTAPVDVVFDEHNVLQPDLVYVSTVRMNIVTPENIQGAPDLVVEILSKSTARRDRETKRKIYARFGVPNYWLVDPRRRSITTYALRSGDYRQDKVARHDEILVAQPFPDLSIPLAKLWR